MPTVSQEVQSQIVNLVREFVQHDVLPIAGQYDNEDKYPHELVPTMRELGLFGITIPEEYGGLGLDHTTMAMIFEELSKGWMSVAGIIGTHHVMASIIGDSGTEEQKEKFLPGMAQGDIRGALGLTEAEAGSDVQNIQTTASKDGENYVLNGSKMFITNGEHGNAVAVLAKTDPNAEPPYRGIGCFIVQKPSEGFSVGQHLDKLGYRGLDTVELVFESVRVPAENLVGDEEGRGYSQVLRALESGRINVAARAVGVATAAFEAAIKYAQNRKAFGKPISQHQAIQTKLADMATKIEAARLLAYAAARKRDEGGRVDLEAGMAKLFASEVCGEVTMEAMRIHGGYGYIKEYPVERYYRDAPLMIIGEGTNEIQKLVIARRLLEKYAV
jgi:alkylation response protein AidB-like acyl-CoA dehydrogenase